MPYELRQGKRWAEPAVPRHVVMAVPVDDRQRSLLHLRSMAVRSAPGVWSFPTGVLELGETIAEGCARELAEEHGLRLLRHRVLGAYESIAPEEDGAQVEQYHWVFTVVGCLVPDVTAASNLEPDKHERMKVCQLAELVDARFWMVHTFHETFREWAWSNAFEVVRLLQELCR